MVWYEVLVAMCDISFFVLIKKGQSMVKANKFSASAKAKIEAAGGTAEEVGYAAKTK